MKNSLGHLVQQNPIDIEDLDRTLKILIPFLYHTQVNQTKRELHNVFIRKLYRCCLRFCLKCFMLCVWIDSYYWVVNIIWCRENLFEEMLQETDEIAVKRKRTQATLHVLQQAYRVCSQPDFIVYLVPFSKRKIIYLYNHMGLGLCVKQTLDELPLEAESVHNHGTDTTGVSKYLDLPTSSSKYTTSSSSYTASAGTGRRSRRAVDQHQNGYGF